MRFKRWQK